jgi:hypothetical protein
VALGSRLYIAVMETAHLKRCLALLLVFTASSAGFSASARAAQMYRYVNDDGHQVVGYQVPPEFVANGYEVLSASGAIIEVIPRQLQDGELDDLDAKVRQEREEKAERERLQQWDESLLLRYSTIEDIEAARGRALRDLRIRVTILKGKLRSLQQQVENYQALAADQERLGNAVNADHLEAIDNLQSEIAATERAVRDRQEEIAVVDASYDRDVERFSTLLDIVELRRSMATRDPD